jgi:hypothetical protein
MTCLIVWLLQSHRQKIDFTSKILRRWRKFAKSIFSMRIWVVRKFSIFFNWSCNLRRFLSTRSIWVEIEANTKNAYSVHLFFQRFMWKRFIFFFLWLLKRVASWLSRIEFAQNAKRIIIDDVCLFIHCFAIHSCFNSFEMNLCIWDFSKSLLSLLVIDLHFLWMMFDMSAIRMQYLIWICNWFKCKSMKSTCVSTFKIEIEMIRNDLKMFRKQRFYMTASLLIIFDFLFLSMCQTKTS